MIKKITLVAIVFMLALLFFMIWGNIGMYGNGLLGWGVAGLLALLCLLLVIVTDFFVRRRFSRYIWRFSRYTIKRLDELDERIDRHSRECPVQKELLLYNCTSPDDNTRNNDVFRRSFQALHPNFVFRLRDMSPSLTPAEELLCMYIHMGLSIAETADRMSISQSSLHTFRYRLKRKLPLEDGTNMDEWLRKIE